MVPVGKLNRKKGMEGVAEESIRRKQQKEGKRKEGVADGIAYKMEVAKGREGKGRGND